MTILLVRHARAGRRDKWVGDDRLRPLSLRGREQAEALPDMLEPWLLGTTPRIITSPWARCVQTVEPLAARFDTALVEDAVLGEGMADKAAEWFPQWLTRRPVVLCTHGDVIEEVLTRLEVPNNRKTAKGAVWVFEGKHGAIKRATLLPPPA